MQVSLDLPEELLKRLQDEADRRSSTVDQVVAGFAAKLPEHGSHKPRRKLRFIGIGKSTDGRSARDVDGFGFRESTT